MLTENCVKALNSPNEYANTLNFNHTYLFLISSVVPDYTIQALH